VLHDRYGRRIRFEVNLGRLVWPVCFKLVEGVDKLRGGSRCAMVKK